MGSKYEGLTDVERLDKYRETLAKLEADDADKRVVGQWRSRVAKLEAEIGVVDPPSLALLIGEGIAPLPTTEGQDDTDTTEKVEETPEATDTGLAPDEDEERPGDQAEPHDGHQDDTEDTTTDREPQPVGNRYPVEDQPTERDMRPTLHKTGTYELTDRGLVSACPHCEAKQVPFGDTGKSSPLSAGNFSRAEVACGVCNKVYVLLPDTNKERVVNLTGEMERQTGQTEAVQDAARAMGGGQHKEQERREEQAVKPKRVNKPTKVGTPCCMCGCGAENKPGSRFKMGHDARVKAALSKVKRGDQDPNTIHPYTIKMFQQYPEIVVAGYGRDEVMKLAGIEG